jgi:ribosomal protein S18 acetylase RimI-like enzyme
MTARIRRLGADDAAQAEKAVRSFKKASRSAGSLETFLRNPANYLLVGEARGRVVGFLMAYRLERADRDANQMFVYEIDVAEDWRRQGLATALLREIVDLARAEGMFEAFVLTSRRNVAARRLYAGTGGRVEDDSAVLFVYPLALESAPNAARRAKRMGDGNVWSTPAGISGRVAAKLSTESGE